MHYLIAFLEGAITFISPCLLPMLPIYVAYFAGGQEDKGRAVVSALSFVAGFTLVFTTMGAFAGTIGYFLRQYQTPINLVTGAVVVLFGLHFLGLIRLNFFRGGGGRIAEKRSPWLSFLFGITFSVSWTPCVGAFLGSALMLASQKGSVFEGVMMLLAYSFGLGIPFVLSAFLIDQLKGTFDFLKKHTLGVSRISGVFLILMGVLMMTGWMNTWLALLSV